MIRTEVMVHEFFNMIFRMEDYKWRKRLKKW